MFTLSKNRNRKGKELRMVIVETLQDTMKSGAQVVAMKADLDSASGFTEIQKSNPDRLIQRGISEASMTGVVAGLSMTGFRSYLHTFGPSIPRGVYDQTFLSGAYTGNTMSIYGPDPELAAGPNGGTYITWEDVALMRAIPHAVVCDVADGVQLDWIIREFARMEGVHYIHADRKNVHNVYEKGSAFEIGKGNIVREGSDVLTIFAEQLMSDAPDCAEVLLKQRVSVGVIGMFRVKPLDEGLITREAVGEKAVVTFENHSIISGLGSAVAEVLAENNISVKFKQHGVKECFGAVGTPGLLQKEPRLVAEDLLQTVENTLKQYKEGLA